MSKKVTIRMMQTTDQNMCTFVLSSEDGTSLSKQDIVDSICEYLLIVEHEYDKMLTVTSNGETQGYGKI